MYIREDLESYKLEYGILQSKYQKLIKENRELRDEIIILNSNIEVFENIGSLVESLDQKSLNSLNKVYESIKRRQLLAVLLGI
jgi:energy-converting hydrogenase A subunit M